MRGCTEGDRVKMHGKFRVSWFFFFFFFNTTFIITLNYYILPYFFQIDLISKIYSHVWGKSRGGLGVFWCFFNRASLECLKKSVQSTCMFKMLKPLTQNYLRTHINPSLTEKSIQAEFTVISGISKGKWRVNRIKF